MPEEGSIERQEIAARIDEALEGERRKVTQLIECYGTRSLMQASRLDELKQLKYRCRERERSLALVAFYLLALRRGEQRAG